MRRVTILRKTLLIGLLTLLMISQAHPASAGAGVWTSLGPEGGSIEALAIDPADPKTLYAGTTGGAFKSTDGGANWSAANTGLTNPYIRALAINPANPNWLYAATEDGVFRSTNAGGNWSAFNTGLTNAKVAALAIDPVTASTLYAGTESGAFSLLQRVKVYLPLILCNY